MEKRSNKNLYDKDFYGWVLFQSHLIKKGDYENMDWEHLQEEIESLGISQKRALQSFLIKFLLHKLKMKYQSHMHTRSWDLSIKSSHGEIIQILKENPSLKPKLPEILKNAYRTARLEAADETGLDEKVFPKECPWSIEEIL